MNISKLLEKSVELNASDIHLVVGKPPVYRINGGLVEDNEYEILSSDKVRQLTYSILNEDQQKKFEKENELDFSFGISNIGRFRVNVHKQRGTIGVALRALSADIPPLDMLGLPKSVVELANHQNGLVLVTGPTGSGKSTTLASLIDKINVEKDHHIITIEDPIEYLHPHKKSLVEQREIASDTVSFISALKYILRQDPDVILVGEMRDLETIKAAITAAETGHLVFATLHTNDAAQTIDRIIDVFPTHQQAQIRLQLSTSLRGVVSQQLIPTKDGKGRKLACEVLIGTPAVANLIREAKTHQIYSTIETGARYGMLSMENSLKKLVEGGYISLEEFKKRARNSQFVF